jgi:hypothetical protein
MATIEVSTIEVLALKKLALVNQALGMQLSDKRAAKEQLALTSVIVDIVRRAESSPTEPDAAG